VNLWNHELSFVDSKQCSSKKVQNETEKHGGIDPWIRNQVIPQVWDFGPVAAGSHHFAFVTVWFFDEMRSICCLPFCSLEAVCPSWCCMDVRHPPLLTNTSHEQVVSFEGN
jgi:hypothetical protein